MAPRDAIAAGASHTCARSADGRVWCWGENGDGQLGDGTRDDRTIPKPVPGISDAVGVAAGRYHSCARLRSGRVHCWGGDGSDDVSAVRARPRAIPGLTGIVEIEAGNTATCGRNATGQVWCWNHAAWGKRAENNRPQSVEQMNTATQLSTGQTEACARLGDGDVACWRLRGPDRLQAKSLGVRDIVSVSVRENRSSRGHLSSDLTCLLEARGSVRCSHPARDAKAPRSPLEAVAGLDDAVFLTAGGGHLCAIRADNQAVCWGSNLFGQLGHATRRTGFDEPARTDRPTPVTGLGKVRLLAAGEAHTCAVTDESRLWCWGLFEHLPDVTDSQVSRVAGLEDAVELAAGASFTCARRATGGVACWGENPLGRSLGNGQTRALTPVEVELEGATRLWAGGHKACARVGAPGGEVHCWGTVRTGDRVVRAAEPTAIARLRPAQDLFLGGGGWCARTDQGMTCAGSLLLPTDGVGRFTRVAPDMFVGCGLTSASRPLCWRRDDPVAKKIAGLARAEDLAVHDNYACADTGRKGIACWSLRDDGRRLVRAPDSASIDQLAASQGSLCGVPTEGGPVSCWQVDTFPRLSLGRRTSVPGVEDARQVVAGRYHRCALLASGGVACWGSRDQRGDGSAMFHTRPTPAASLSL